MNNNGCQKPLELFATCLQSSAAQADSYVRRVTDIARWSEQYGCKGILAYTDNSLVDAWLVSQIIIQSTEKLCPLVAVQIGVGGCVLRDSLYEFLATSE
jgi:hypothetical protein